MTELRKKIDLLYGVSDIKDLPDVIDQILQELKNAEDYADNEEKSYKKDIRALKSEMSGLEDTIEELQQSELSNSVETGLSKEGIQWKADNLLDQQVMDALGDAIKKLTPLGVLRLLQAVAP